MADTLSEKLLKVQPHYISQSQWDADVAALHKAAAELDRREAIVRAAEEWAKAERTYQTSGDVALLDQLEAAATALLTLLPAAALKG